MKTYHLWNGEMTITIPDHIDPVEIDWIIRDQLYVGAEPDDENDWSITHCKFGSISRTLTERECVQCGKNISEHTIYTSDHSRISDHTFTTRGVG